MKGLAGWAQGGEVVMRFLISLACVWAFGALLIAALPG